MAAETGSRSAGVPRLAFFAVIFAVGAVVFGARPVVSYRALDLGASNAEIGLIASAFALFALLGALPLGRLVDGIGPGPVVVVGAASIALTLAGMTGADSLLLLAVGQAVLGLGQLMVVIGGQAMLTNLSSGENRDSRIGYYYVATALGQSTGPVIAGLFIGAAGTRVGGEQVLLVASAAAAAAAILALRFRSAGRRALGDDRGGRRSTLAEMVRRPGMRQAIVSSIVLLTALDLMLAYLPVYGEARNIPPQTIGLAIGALGVSQVTSRLALARLTRAFGYTAVLVLSMLAPALVISALLAPIDGALVVAVMFLVGLGLGLGQPLTLILVALASNTRSRGQAASLRMVGNRLGQLVLPASVGATAGQAGVAGILVAITVMLGLGSLLIALDRPRAMQIDAEGPLDT